MKWWTSLGKRQASGRYPLICCFSPYTDESLSASHGGAPVPHAHDYQMAVVQVEETGES
jgi:hypothetical protein